MSVYIRRLSVEEKIARVAARFDREIAAHNAHAVETLHVERVPSLRHQVLGEFTGPARRLAA